MALLYTLVLLVNACSDHAPQSQTLLRLDGTTMGTTWSAQLGDSSVDSVALEQALVDELDRINQLMSTWDPQSQISQFNSSNVIEPVRLHDDTLSVIDAARRISWLTGERYDITLDPVIRLWGFGSNPELDTPSDQELAHALSRTGHGMLVRTGDTIRKRRADVSIDVSSLAKGFAVDRLGEVLESFDVVDYLVEIGGELRARGNPVPGESWQVGVEQPDGGVQTGLRLHNSSVASSGSYRNYREEKGKRLSHIIDGRSGRPIEHALVAVSVVHESTMLADAWATALLVVGDHQARKLIEQQSLAAQLTIRANQSFVVYRSPEFSALSVESL